MDEFLSLHKPQLLASGVPEIFWPKLYGKLQNQIFDSGEAFSLLMIDYGDDEEEQEAADVWAVITSRAISQSDPSAIFLIDHAFTFRTDTFRAQLQANPEVIDRLCNMMGIAKDKLSREECEAAVAAGIWRLASTYNIDTAGLQAEDRLPIWYVTDELGIGVAHSDTPNFRMVPFLHIPEEITYSLLFPVADADEGDRVTRDFAEGVPEGAQRDALLLPWRERDMTEQLFEQKEPGEAYFLAGHIKETLPNDIPTPAVKEGRMRVYAEYDLVKKFLTAPEFEVIENDAEADILWFTKHFKGFAELSEAAPDKFVNQFPFEHVITIKDLLSVVARRSVPVGASKYSPDTLDTFPVWLPTTFNLKTELVEFVSYYQHRARRGKDNHWIVKPWNLARGLDTHVTGSLAHIVRLSETGPKIAQKYIERPVLFRREDVDGAVKFDLRYVLLLKSAAPLEAYVYRHFFVRFANKPFVLGDFDDYERHFTVMNYKAATELKHMTCAEFLAAWQEQFPDYAYAKVEASVCEMLKELLKAAVNRAPPCGIAPSAQSRALYAADLMLQRDETDGRIQPKLLEINWMPDCQRACLYYPDFFNDIFKLLFRDECNPDSFKRIV